MNDFRNTIRLAREVDAIRNEIETVSTPEQVEALEKKVAALHTEVAAAVALHRAKQPWYGRWIWTLRLRRFEALGRRTGRA